MAVSYLRVLFARRLSPMGEKQTYASVTRMSATYQIGDMDFAAFSPLAVLLYESTS
jgi:hypothetical protein